MKFYMVGGAVRDEILGIPSKDVDFSVVLDESECFNPHSWEIVDPFQTMVSKLRSMGYTIFVETPEHLTVRARFPTIDENAEADPNGIFAGKYFNGLTADFVLARKEGTYSDGRRPDSVEPGTLEDDLARRDFTMNAIAKDSDGNLIDPFDGVSDIKMRTIRAVGDPMDRLVEDALRAVRALRFAVTKGFGIDSHLAFDMQSEAVLHALRTNISDERIREELSKMFRHDTVLSLELLSDFPYLTAAMFSGSISLDATMKQKGRGK